MWRTAGDLAAAEAAFRRALDLAPLRKEAAGELIRVLADRGRAADALQLYEAFRVRRREELELAPSAELEELIDELKRAPPAASAAESGDAATGAGADLQEAAGSSGGTAGEPSPPATTSEAGGVPRRTGGPGEGGPRRWRSLGRRTLLGGLVALGLLAAAGAGAWYLLGASAETGPAADRSVAVLPFRAIGSEDPGPVAEGLHADLLTRLSNVSGLKVTSATSVERYRDTHFPLPAVADSLGVRWLLEGDVQRSGDRIRINAQLIDPRTDTHAWAESYERELTAENLFELQSELARRIARSLEARLSPAERERITRRPTADLEAYQLYVRGRSGLDTRTEEGIRDALGHFRRALERDSTYALAWSGLADAASLLGSAYESYRTASEFSSATGGLPRAADAARRALELAPDLAEAHASMALVHIHRLDGPAALRELERAVELKPSYAQAHQWLGLLLAHLGQIEEAHEHLVLAVALNPEHAAAQGVLSWTFLARGDVERAETHVRRLPPLGGQRAGLMARVLYHDGRWEELERLASERLDVGEDESPVPALEWRVFLARIEALRGDTAGARGHLAEIRRRTADDGQAIFEGLVHAALGDPDAAFSAWAEIDDHRLASHRLRYFYADILDPLREDPRFSELIRALNRAWGLNPDGSLPAGDEAT